MASSKPIIKEGYVKFQSKKIGVWKKRWLVLRTLTSNGRSDVVLEKYTDETGSLMGQVRRLIRLDSALVICRVPDSDKKHAISILLEATLECIRFALESESDATAWLTAINNECASPNSASKDKFVMYAMRNAKLPIQGECTLLVSATDLTVLNARQQEVVQWPLHKLRRYAVERRIFSVEAGRSSSTGEGTFLFEGDEADVLYQRINFLVKNAASNQQPRLMVSAYPKDEPPSYNDINNQNSQRLTGGSGCGRQVSSISSASSFNDYNGSEWGGSESGSGGGRWSNVIDSNKSKLPGYYSARRSDISQQDDYSG